MDTKLKKQQFLTEEFLMFSLNAGLQTRGYQVYMYNGKGCADLRADIKSYLVQYAQEFDKSTEDYHFEKIELLSRFLSEKYSNILLNSRFRIGISQKIINLFLKYMWTAGNIKMPFHCPFDGKIKSKLLKGNGTIFLQDWTMFDTIDEYEKYVSLARIKAAELQLKIAEWELVNWNRK
jgi:hypothetical protein